MKIRVKIRHKDWEEARRVAPEDDDVCVKRKQADGRVKKNDTYGPKRRHLQRKIIARYVRRDSEDSETHDYMETCRRCSMKLET